MRAPRGGDPRRAPGVMAPARAGARCLLGKFVPRGLEAFARGSLPGKYAGTGGPCRLGGAGNPLGSLLGKFLGSRDCLLYITPKMRLFYIAL